MALRPYQQEAFEAARDWVRKSTDPCLVEAVTAAGKSHIIAALALWLHNQSGGKQVLCIAPSSELVTQNREKYVATGNPASLFSASAGEVSQRHPVVFGTPGTVKNKIGRFGARVCAIIVDEAHGITPTLKFIIEKIREANPNVRVVGFTATPYRLGDGYIYAMDDQGQPVPESQARDPYFTRLVYRITGNALLSQGYLTPPAVGSINAGGYQTAGMMLNSRGQFDKADIDKAFHGHGRKTSLIVADIVAQSRERKGVMIFAATIQHAEECMASLPPALSAIVTGKTKKKERDRIIARFKSGQIKYLVNVSVLTTGFDATHVDVVALLRLTESVGLLQQMIGRGLRLHDGKDDCLVLDYAENIERHCPDGDVFSPKIKAAYKGGEAELMEAHCPECSAINLFSARPNPDGLQHDKAGYFVDLAGHHIMTEAGPMPAHYGRRCTGLIRQGPTHVRCEGRWTSKPCPHCGDDNDIAARYCSSCKGEIVDPAEKLQADFKRYKRDPTQLQTDEVLLWQAKPSLTRKGKECIICNVVTPYRSFTVWLHPYIKGGKLFAEHAQAYEATAGFTRAPNTVTYRKDPESGFYSFHGFNAEVDAV